MLKDFGFFLEDLKKRLGIFLHGELYLSFHNSSFCLLKIHFLM
jgi:hypothetical protein